MLGVIKKLPSDLPLDAVTLFTMKLQGRRKLFFGGGDE